VNHLTVDLPAIVDLETETPTKSKTDDSPKPAVRYIDSPLMAREDTSANCSALRGFCSLVQWAVMIRDGLRLRGTKHSHGVYSCLRAGLFLLT
jgi:hypothetical protein